MKWVAERGPSSIRGVSLAVHRNYKNVYVDMRDLAKQRLVTRYKDNDVKGWWTTPVGLIRAIDFGADPSKVLNRLESMLPNKRSWRETREEFRKGMAICYFALEHKQDWAEVTSRDVLLWNYIGWLGPIAEHTRLRRRIIEEREASKHLSSNEPI